MMGKLQICAHLVVVVKVHGICHMLLSHALHKSAVNIKYGESVGVVYQ
jgi:hypothetical protein